MALLDKPAWSWGLVEALEDDPFYAAITIDAAADAARRREMLRAYFELSMVECQKIGCGWVLEEDGPGAAIWLLPAPAETIAEACAAKAAALAAALGPRGLENYTRMVAFMAPRGEQVLGGAAWYLSILGVAPSAQGRGLGSRLLAPTLREADQAGAVCFAETYSPRNLAFYQRLGFAAAASYVEPVTAAEYWVMVRPPVGAAG